LCDKVIVLSVVTVTESVKVCWVPAGPPVTAMEGLVSPVLQR
jgi:hypothetical protein